MKKLQMLASVMALTLATAAHAATIQIADYALGEPGSIGVADPYTPLVDSIGGGSHNIPNWNEGTIGNPVPSVLTSGLAAPGSTHALQVTDNELGPQGTWYGSSYGLLDDNWAFDLWVRPDATSGTYLGSTDGNGNTQVGLRLWATNTFASGTSLGGNSLSAGSNYLLMSNGSGFLGDTTSTYSTGTWYRVSMIRHTGTVHYYLDGILQDSANTAGRVNDIRLGAGYWATAATNAAFDEMKVWTFSESDTLDEVRIAMGILVVPEPSTFLIWSLGLLGLAWYARRRRTK